MSVAPSFPRSALYTISSQAPRLSCDCTIKALVENIQWSQKVRFRLETGPEFLPYAYIRMNTVCICYVLIVKALMYKVKMRDKPENNCSQEKSNSAICLI